MYITDKLQQWDQVKKLEPQVFINPRFTCVLTFQEMAIQRLYSLIFQHHKNINIIPCFESCNFGNVCFHFKTITPKSSPKSLLKNPSFTMTKFWKDRHDSTGNASLLAQLLMARGDPDALGANGETVRDTRRFLKKNGANLKKKHQKFDKWCGSCWYTFKQLIYIYIYRVYYSKD